MNIDRYILANEPGWDRLEQLTTRARRTPRDLAPEEVDELVRLYQRTSTQLSYARGHFRDRALTARLTRTVAAANAVLYGSRARTARPVVQFFLYGFPGAVYHSRRFMFASAALFLASIAAVWIWLLNDPVAMDASAPAPYRRLYVEELFEPYYEPGPVFFSKVTVNNILISVAVFGLGIVVPLYGPTYVLALNGMYVGQVAAWMSEAGDTGRFLGFILPHGMLELTAIMIAGGASLALGWALVAPGDRRRAVALAEEGRRLIVVVLGVAVMLVLSGIIEGFITGSGLPVWVRVGIGALGWVAVIAYLVVQGRAAAAQGVTGALGERGRRRWSDERTLGDAPDPPGVLVPQPLD